MIIEYAGQADRQVGAGVVHEVRAWWNVNQDTQGEVKRAASAAVRKEVGKGGSVAFESWDMSTYSHPQLNAMIRVRVLTDEQVKARRELKDRRYSACDGDGDECSNVPGRLVRVDEKGTEKALCYTCLRTLPKGTYQVLHWIKADGRLQL